MKFHKLWSMLENQNGFSLLEMIAVLAITGFLSVGVTAATVQVVNQGAYNSDYNTATRHMLNAIHWISRDAQMAQTLEPNGPSGFPLNLSWVEWDNTNHQVIYGEAGDKLYRSYSVDGGATSEIMIAQYINWVSDNTTCEVNGDILTVKVTATMGTGLNAVSVTREREITPRPGL